MFPGISEMSLSDGEKFTLNNKMYYLFTLTGLPRAADILVDCNTGELFFYDIGLEPVDINTWYLDYRDAHDWKFRIDDNFWFAKFVRINI